MNVRAFFMRLRNNKCLVLLSFVFRFEIIGIAHCGCEANQYGYNSDEKVSSVCQKLLEHDIRVLTVSKVGLLIEFRTAFWAKNHWVLFKNCFLRPM
jgi:hypothetical protein